MDPLTLDGNSVAGLLQEVFAAEMTTAVGTCNNCGASEPIGAVRGLRWRRPPLPPLAQRVITIIRSNTNIRLSFSGAHVDDRWLVVPVPGNHAIPRDKGARRCSLVM